MTSKSTLDRPSESSSDARKLLPGPDRSAGPKPTDIQRMLDLESVNEADFPSRDVLLGWADVHLEPKLLR